MVWREQLAALESGAPWFAAWRETGAGVAAELRERVSLHEALNLQKASVRFVPQAVVPDGMAYERFIFETGNCPTREGLHDFFNGLCWLQFPLAKQRLNEIQAAQIAAQGVADVRGAVRDAATLFDENGALLDAPPEIWAALLAHDWQRLFIQLRPLWKEARLLVFGHALLEKLVAPRKGLTAHVWRASEPALAGKPFTPLPVLGVPGWWPGNEDFSFYDDAQVFRPRRAP
jgi:hypothetical protein